MGARMVWAVAGGFLCGVFARSVASVGISWALFSLALSIAALLVAALEREKRAAAIIIAAAIGSFGGGIARMEAATLRGDPVLTARLGQTIELIGSVAEEPDARESATLLSIRADALVQGSSTRPVHAGVLARLPSHAAVRYGDRVRISGKLELPEAFESGPGRQFDYPSFLAKEGIGYLLVFADIEALEGSDANPVKAAALGVKQAYLRGERAALPEPEAGLAGGITVGDKRSVGPELDEAFRRVSLSHMIVLSGYNITVVVNAIRYLASALPLLAQHGAAAFAVFFFVLMTGGAASAVRAGAMALIAVFARSSGRLFFAGRVLAVVSLGMVLYNPFTLVFDPGFQLSALATIGLIALTPIFAGRLARLPDRFGIREIASSTLATQTAVLPLLLWQNGALSLVGLPANILALLPVPLAMLFSFAAAIGGLVLGPLAPLAAFPAYALLAYIIAVARLFASLPFASVSVPAFGLWWAVAAYLLIGAYVWRVKKTGGVAPAGFQSIAGTITVPASQKPSASSTSREPRRAAPSRPREQA